MRQLGLELKEMGISLNNSIVDLERIQNTFTSRRHFFQRLENTPIKLRDFLVMMLPFIEEKSWDKRFLLGGVFVNGKPVYNVDEIIIGPSNIEYYEPKFDIEKIEEFFPKFDKNNIVYEKDGIVIYYKPRKLPTIPSKEQRFFNLRTYLEKYYDSSVHVPSRLDTSTQGLVIGSYKEQTHEFVQKLFEYKKIQKFYILKVNGLVDWDEYDCNFCIDKSKDHPVLRVSSNEGKKAETIFTVVKRDKEENSTILIAKPITGRTHQIRVHISSLGFPIIGDNFYNGKMAPALNLICFKLKFKDKNDEEKTIIAPENLVEGIKDLKEYFNN